MEATHIAIDTLAVNRDFDMLAPKFAMTLQYAISEANTNGLHVALFEGWRAPQRQAWLYAQGRFGNTEKVVTNAQEWQSWHQFGLAGDIVFKDERGHWNWGGDYERLDEIMLAHGLQKGPRFEHAHYELTGGLNIMLARQLAQACGLQRVWLEVFHSSSLKLS